MHVTGAVRVSYGEPGAAKSCAALPTLVQVNFDHSNTAGSRAAARLTPSYRLCEEQKSAPEWTHRAAVGGAPAHVSACWGVRGGGGGATPQVSSCC